MKPHNPIDHVVIIVKENHSFDNYFGTFPGANGAKLPAAQDPPAGDPPHNHAAWLERATHGEGAVRRKGHSRLFFVCETIHAVRQLLHGSGQPVRTEPSDAYRGGFADHRQREPDPDVPAAGTLQNSDASEGAGKREAELGHVRRPGVQLLRENRGAERQQEYSAVDKIRHGRGGRDIAERVVGVRAGQSRGAFRAPALREKRRAKDGEAGEPVDGGPRPQTGAEQALGELGDLYYLGRLGRLVRPCRSATAEREVDGWESGERTELCEYPIQLWDARRVPGDQSVLQEGNFQGVSFACEPGEVLRRDVWVETDKRERRERRGFG